MVGVQIGKAAGEPHDGVRRQKRSLCAVVAPCLWLLEQLVRGSCDLAEDADLRVFYESVIRSR